MSIHVYSHVENGGRQVGNFAAREPRRGGSEWRCARGLHEGICTGLGLRSPHTVCTHGSYPPSHRKFENRVKLTSRPRQQHFLSVSHDLFMTWFRSHGHGSRFNVSCTDLQTTHIQTGKVRGCPVPKPWPRPRLPSEQSESAPSQKAKPIRITLINI